MKSMVREFSKGSVIFREGDTGNLAFILTEGSVEISVGSGKKRAVVSLLKPVSVFGEMALLLKEQKRTATAIANSNSKVAEISRRDFDEFVEKSPKLINAVLTVLVERLQTTTNKVSRNQDLFMGVAWLIDLVTQHSTKTVKYNSSLSMIHYDQLMKTACEAFLADAEEVQKVFKIMENLGLLDFRIDKDVQYIDVLFKNDFIDRCTKIHKSLESLGKLTSSP